MMTQSLKCSGNLPGIHIDQQIISKIQMLPYELDEKGIHDLFITIDAIQDRIKRIRSIHIKIALIMRVIEVDIRRYHYREVRESLRRIKEIQDTIPDFDITPFKANADNSAQIL